MRAKITVHLSIILRVFRVEATWNKSLVQHKKY